VETVATRCPHFCGLCEAAEDAESAEAAEAAEAAAPRVLEDPFFVI
jgi:hypothetical protein